MFLGNRNYIIGLFFAAVLALATVQFGGLRFLAAIPTPNVLFGLVAAMADLVSKQSFALAVILTGFTYIAVAAVSSALAHAAYLSYLGIRWLVVDRGVSSETTDVSPISTPRDSHTHVLDSSSLPKYSVDINDNKTSNASPVTNQEPAPSPRLQR